jgi:hypothetical protein
MGIHKASALYPIFKQESSGLQDLPQKASGFLEIMPIWRFFPGNV